MEGLVRPGGGSSKPDLANHAANKKPRHADGEVFLLPGAKAQRALVRVRLTQASSLRRNTQLLSVEASAAKA